VKHALVVHGDGLDELSTLVLIRWRTVGGCIEHTERDFRVRILRAGVVVKPEELFGGDATTNAGIVRTC